MKQYNISYYGCFLLLAMLLLAQFGCRKDPSPFGSYGNQAEVPIGYRDVLLVYFKDKGQDNYSLDEGDQFLSSRALARRDKQQITLDSTDLPVSPGYLKELLEVSQAKLLNTSRWLNYAVLYLPDIDLDIDIIRNLPFVASVRDFGIHEALPSPLLPSEYYNGATDARSITTSAALDTIPVTMENYYESYVFLSENNATFLHEQGFYGDDKYIALLSANGFGYIDFKPELKQVVNENRIIDMHDFLYGENLQTSSIYGAFGLGILAAINPRQYIGTAPRAHYALMRVDMRNIPEPFFETAWVAAIERADSLGVDVVGSTVVYGIEYAQRGYLASAENTDGTSISSLAAALSLEKGILTIQMMPGRSRTSFVPPPADAKNILTVGNLLGWWPSSSVQWNSEAINKPTADGRIKPELAITSWYTKIIYGQEGGGKIASFDGNIDESFSSAIFAGMAACLWQALPELSAKELREVLLKTAEDYNKPNNITGYGVPDLEKAYEFSK